MILNVCVFLFYIFNRDIVVDYEKTHGGSWTVMVRVLTKWQHAWLA